MIDFTDPLTAHVRLANSERDDAVAQLNANLREGRIDETEFNQRAAVARTAVTRGDLAPLFSDLPSSSAAAGASGTGLPAPGVVHDESSQRVAPPNDPQVGVGGAAPYSDPGSYGDPGGYGGGPAGYGGPGVYGGPGGYGGGYGGPGPGGMGRRGPLGGTAGTVAVSISPFVALVLFFLSGALFGWTYAWLWFLLVPLTAIIVYGAGTRDRGRYRNR